MIVVLLNYVESKILHHCFLLDTGPPNLPFLHYPIDSLGHSRKNVHGICIIHACRQEIRACGMMKEPCGHCCAMKLLRAVNVLLLLLDDQRRDSLSVGVRNPMRQHLCPVQRASYNFFELNR